MTPAIQQHKFTITMDDGQLVIMSFVVVGRGNLLPRFASWLDEKNGWWFRASTDEAVRDEMRRAYPEYDLEGNRRAQPVSHRRIADQHLPTDRTYRGAWRDDGAAIVHDMPKAREIHLRNLRAKRAAKLEQLDRDWMRATGQGKKQEADKLEQERQKLRDLPASIGVDRANTVDELKALTSPLLE